VVKFHTFTESVGLRVWFSPVVGSHPVSESVGAAEARRGAARLDAPLPAVPGCPPWGGGGGPGGRSPPTRRGGGRAGGGGGARARWVAAGVDGMVEVRGVAPRVGASRPVVKFHPFTESVGAAEARRVPSGLNATLRTVPVCRPLRVRMTWPVVTSQIL